MKNYTFVASPQVPTSHYLSGYDNSRRWSSYWIQIDQAMNMPEGRLLEIGVGHALVVDYLRKVIGKDVTTVDIDPALHPDIVADIADLPFQDKGVECVMACEVLEHMPFEHAQRALKELRRVANRAIISVPNSGKGVQINVLIGRRTLPMMFPLPWLMRRKAPAIPKEHFWELEMSGFSVDRFRGALNDCGWTIRQEIRNPNNPFHHFFILE
jgi:SAM-dependent methyltransferase